MATFTCPSGKATSNLRSKPMAISTCFDGEAMLVENRV